MTSHDLLIESARATPPVAVTGWITFVSTDIDFWIKALTVIFLLLQIVLMAEKRIRMKRRKGDE